MKPNRYNYNSQTGMYRHKILIRQRVITQDELLQEIEDYIEWGNYWAMVKTSKNKDSFSAGQESTEYSKRFVVKYSASLQGFIDSEHTSFEIVQNGITYDVKEAIDDNDLHNTITIYCEVRV